MACHVHVKNLYRNENHQHHICYTYYKMCWRVCECHSFTFLLYILKSVGESVNTVVLLHKLQIHLYLTLHSNSLRERKVRLPKWDWDNEKDCRGQQPSHREYGGVCHYSGAPVSYHRVCSSWRPAILPQVQQKEGQPVPSIHLLLTIDLYRWHQKVFGTKSYILRVHVTFVHCNPI